MAPWPALAPLLSVFGGALIVLLAEAFLKGRREDVPGYLAILSLAAGGFFTVHSWGRSLSAFDGRLVLDRLALVLTAALLLLGLIVLLTVMGRTPRLVMSLGPLGGLLLLSISGLMVMVSSSDGLIVFLGLEIVSVASYALTGLRRTDPASAEAAAKYFLMGSFAGAFLVFGLALIYGAWASLDLSPLRLQGLALPPAATTGLALLITALAFKAALVPFHMWAPDVYEGAPTPVTAFLTVGPKAAALAVLLRVLAPLWKGLPGSGPLRTGLWAVAVLTMFVGNLAALRQTSVKRMLAYSSIAHSGYLLIAVISGDASGLLFYVVVYLFMNAGAFAALTAVAPSGTDLGSVSLDDLAGLGRLHPGLAACFSVFLLSLAGFPPTAGFLAKFYVFSAAVSAGDPILVVLAVLASLVSVAYYLKVIMAMFMKEPADGISVETDSPALSLALFLCLWAVVQLGIWPGNLLVFVRQAAASLF